MKTNLIFNQTYLNFPKNNLNFRGENFREYVGNIKLIHETSFFREPQTDEFVKEYLEETFLSKDIPINIAVGACSIGNEAYSQAMLYDEYTDKVNILGFDIGPKSIERAKKGVYLMQNLYTDTRTCISSDAYLVGGVVKTKKQKQYSELFDKYFARIPDGNPKDFESRSIFRGSVIFEKVYGLKDGMAKNCSFELGDIRKLDALMEDESAHCIFFRNALYHLVCADSMRRGSNRFLQDNSNEIIRDIATQANKKLVDGGLFVFGENENRQGVNVKNVYRIMQECGFEPFNTKYRMTNSPNQKLAYHESLYTNVWRKVG
ncbi:hypothetical protein IJ425_06465 [bacterium]|nr:hypothetical protein [bacterium]